MLTSGENVEPQPVEDVLCCSPYIKFAGAAGSLPACLPGLEAMRAGLRLPSPFLPPSLL